MSNQTEVATKVEELSTTLNCDVEDIEVTISDGFEKRVISGADVKQYLTEGEDGDQEDDIEDVEDTSEAGEDTIEDGDDDESTSEAGDEVDIHFEEMDYKDLQKLASEELDEYPSDQSKTGLVEALEAADISSADEDISEADEDTTSGGENDEDAPLHPDEAENPTKENYVFHFGVCDSDDCSYGTANEESDYCASCKKKHGDSSKSSTSNDSSQKSNADSVQEVKDLFDVSQTTAEAVVFRTETKDDFDSFGEAVEELA